MSEMKVQKKAGVLFLVLWLAAILSAAFPVPGSCADSSASSGGSFPYRFPKPVTVAGLELEMRQTSQDSFLSLLVYSSLGERRPEGSVCTGDTVMTVYPDGSVQSRVTAVIPGDLTGCGAPTPKACELIYASLLEDASLSENQLAAGDLNRNGMIDTADLLALKKTLAGSA